MWTDVICPLGVSSFICKCWFLLCLHVSCKTYRCMSFLLKWIYTLFWYWFFEFISIILILFFLVYKLTWVFLIWLGLINLFAATNLSYVGRSLTELTAWMNVNWRTKYSCCHQCIQAQRWLLGWEGAAYLVQAKPSLFFSCMPHSLYIFESYGHIIASKQHDIDFASLLKCGEGGGGNSTIISSRQQSTFNSKIRCHRL